MLAGMIASLVGWVYAMIGGEEDGVFWLHRLLHLLEPGVNFSQGLSVSLAIPSMAPQHVEFYQINEEQPRKIPFEPAQGCFHTVPIGLRVIALSQPASGEEVLDFTDADYILAMLLEQVE